MVGNTNVFIVTVRGRPYRVEVGDLSRSPVEVRVDGEAYLVDVTQPERPTPTPRQESRPSASVAPSLPPRPEAQSASAARAPMPGKIIAVRVKVGDHVHHGDEIYVLEAMKMEQAVRSTVEGVVSAVRVQEGQTVAYGDTMVEFT